MIFATVGSMLPFDRFVAAVDRWVARNPREDAFIQIGGGSRLPEHTPYARMLSPAEFDRRVAEAQVIVAHAGMGSVIQAARAAKPLVLFPRRKALNEHTTDHQLHTVAWLKDRPGIFVAMDEYELGKRIAEAEAYCDGPATLPATAPTEFITRLRAAIIP